MRKGLQWTEEDSRAVADYLERYNRGEVETVIITRDNIHEALGLPKDKLQWTERDTQIVEQHKKDVASGKITPMNFLELKRE